MSEPDGKSDDAAAISSLAKEFAVPLDAEGATRLQAFVALFSKWNRSINLASIRSERELINRHLIDSFALAALAGTVETAADVGAGGGLPSIPLAVLMPATAFTLFEPNRKKVAFLRTAIRELGISGRVQVEARSVEAPVAPPWRDSFQLALSRATLAPPSWLELGRQLLRPGGRVAVFVAGESGLGLPSPLSARSYGEGRELLLFGR